MKEASLIIHTQSLGFKSTIFGLLDPSGTFPGFWQFAVFTNLRAEGLRTR